MSHWIFQVLGKPWESGARGPDSFDCYGLLYWVKKNHFEDDIPCLQDMHFSNLLNVSNRFRENMVSWEKISFPVDGCAVAMSQVKTGFIHHCGIYSKVDGGLVVHAAENKHVVAETIQSLLLHGWKNISFFELKR